MEIKASVIRRYEVEYSSKSFFHNKPHDLIEILQCFDIKHNVSVLSDRYGRNFQYDGIEIYSEDIDNLDIKTIEKEFGSKYLNEKYGKSGETLKDEFKEFVKELKQDFPYAKYYGCYFIKFLINKENGNDKYFRTY
ncbi:hypothetical protein [Helicobacter anatolicus]|uniref:hypothetical protein n=1 Tax=Helicobacter anatolicus TaxID=2905874 RepID=UPI001E58914A|nr:hypothetical protein [Helicobacter anatolicus]MCE3038773.1 hypothetical protein [Helicobacter anatolicus]